MFKKKPTVKPLAPIRSSDRRKIADGIISEYQLEVPEVPVVKEDGPEKEPPSGFSAIGSLRNSLLPEGSMSARVTTTHGPDQHQVSGTIYVGSQSNDEQRVLWLKLDDRIYPTVYTLWRHPNLIPLLHTTDNVVMKMQGGSDLMTPGLAGPPFPQKAKKGSVVAVAGLSKPSVPIVVGNCEIDISSLENVQGVKGHAVRGVHWSGDELWSWSANGQPGIPPPDEISGWMDEAQNQDAAAKAMEDLDLEDNDEQGGVALHPDASAQPPETLHEGDLPMPNKTETAETSLAVKEIDDIFRKAFTYGIYQAKINNKDDPKHGITFPISQSSVVSNFISPYLPITSPSQAAQLQIKRTSWKSVTKFIKALDKEKILKSKDRNGGETVILDIDFDGRQILDFKPYKLPSKDTTGAESGGGGGGKAASAGRSGDSSLGQSLKLLNLYRPKPSLNQIFEIADASTKDLYTPTELRNVIMSYVDKERLADKRFVKLDPIIANAVFDGSTSLDQEILAKGTVPRDALVYRIQHSCSPFWILLRNEETRDKVKAKSGHGPKIHIVLETRSGNKTVTKVSGVEAFYIAPQVLASELQRTCASSTSVDQLVGSSPKNPVQEIMVQGPQQDAVIKALEDRGVRRQWVEVNNKTKGKKKTAG